MNMIKVLWRRFKKWLGTFTMLLVEGSSETRILRHVYDYVFRFRNFGNTKSMRLIFFRKIWIISAKFQKCSEKSENLFCFWDNWMWIGIVKLSLLRTRYFHWAANVLTSSTKILRVNKKDFLELSWLGSDQRIWKRCCDEDFKSSWEPLPSCFLKGPLERDFWDIYMTIFSESVISEIQNLWGSSFFSIFLYINLYFKTKGKDSEKKIQKIPEKIRKIFSQIIASQLVSLKCLY